MYKREKTREKIISTASQLFYRHGFDKTSMEDIAVSAGKAKGSLYYYFSSKEELFQTVVYEEIESIKETLKAIVDNKSLPYLERLKQYLVTRMQLIRDSQNYIQIIKLNLQSRITDENSVSLLSDIHHDFDKWETTQLMKIIQGSFVSLNSRIKTAKVSLDFDPAASTDMILTIIRGLELQFFLQDKFKDYSPTFNFLAEMIISSLLNKEVNL